MTRKFTRILAALALLVGLTIPMGMWGQTWTRVTSVDDLLAGGTFILGYEATANSGVIIPMQNEGTATLSAAGYMHSGTTQGSSTNGTIDMSNVTSTSLYEVTIVASTSVSGAICIKIGDSFLGNTNTKNNCKLFASESNTTAFTPIVKTNNTFELKIAANQTYFDLQYNSGSPRFAVYSGAQKHPVIYKKETGGTPTCATPTFSPAAGTYTQAQNVSISCATEGATIYYTTNGDDPTTSSNVYSAPISITETTTVKAMATADGYNNSTVATAAYNIVNIEHAGTEADPYSVADARAAIDANVGISDVYATGIVSEIVTAYNSNYGNITFDIVDELGNTATLRAYRCGGTEAANVAVNDVVVVSGNLIKYGSIYEFAEGCQLVSLTHPVVTTPSVTVTPNVINATAEGVEGTLAITYENIPDLISFDYYFCDANGDELEDAIDWIDAEINEEDGAYTVSYTIYPNDGAARTANIKVYTTDVPGNVEVYDIVTINQEEYVAPTYAELPFSFNSGRADIETTDGLYQEGLGTDYNASTNPNTQLKFDGTGDWLLLQFEERPGILTFDIKGNSFSGGTFKVQTSENGTTYVDLAEYTELGDADTKTFDDLGESIRYIKWIYSNKATGNVGLGNISLAAYVAPVPTITVEPTTISATAEETEGTLNVTYTAIETSLGASIYWYTDATATNTTTMPQWIDAEINATTLNVDYVIAENNGEARTAYFKVYGIDAEFNDIYSDLVTVTQAAVPQQYTLTVEPFENLELITFVNDEMEMEEDGTILVTAGDQVMLSIVADEGYVMETLMVNGVDHVNDIAADFTYTFEMPAEAVTISATAVEIVAPTAGTITFGSASGSTAITAESLEGQTATDNMENTWTITTVFPDNTNTSFTQTADYSQVGSSKKPATSITFTMTFSESVIFTSFEAKFGGFSGTAGNITLQVDETTVETGSLNETADVVVSNTTEVSGTTLTVTVTDIAKGVKCYYISYTLGSNETYPTLTIEPNQWYLIASPIEDAVNPVAAGLITHDDSNVSTYALYSFDQTQEKEWCNYKSGTFNLVNGMGYLYANQTGCTLIFTGTTPSGENDISVSLVKDDEVELSGYNLVGNPFAETAYINRPFYKMNSSGTGIMTQSSTGGIEAMEGVFVMATEDGETMTFTTTPPTKGSMIALNLNQGRGTIDRAIVSFSESHQLPKFQLFENSTKIYIPQGNQDYAVVCSEGQGELPVNFRASENGTYTLSMDVENMDVNYLHLIDNMTGMDVDLLQTPSYTFEATTRDYESRFKLVFAGASASAAADEAFAFFSNGSLIISNEGEATLQVIDLTGRILSSESISGSCSTRINATAGVYMLRLINGDNVKVQKIVVR